MAGPEVKTPVNSRPERSESMAKSGTRPALIEQGRVITVNPSTYTVDVRTQMPPYKPKFDIPWMSPYSHHNQGEGINFMPEVGSVCWICTPSEEGAEAFVLGWAMPEEEGSYRTGREFLNPGDIHLSTRDGNFVHLRRGGVVQVGATPVCQQVFIPVRNVMQAFSENYEIHTPAGDLVWQVLRKEEDKGGHQRCQFVLGAHEFADDPAKDPEKDPIALLKIGSHGDGDDRILTLLTRDKGGGSTKTELSVRKDGSLEWTIQKDCTLKIKGDFKSTINGKMNVSVDQDLSLSSKQAFAASGMTASVKGDSSAELKATGPVTVNGAAVKLGDAQFPVMVLSPEMAAFLGQLTTTVNALGGAVGLPPVKPPILMSSKKVTA